MPELNNTILKNSSSLKAYYRMSTGVLTTDSSGNGYTLTNTNTVADATGVFGGAADSGTSNSNKLLSVASNLGIAGGNITINLWFNSYATTFAGDHPPLISLLSDLTGGAGVAYVLGINTTGLFAARLKSGVSWQETAATAISASTWYMATLTYDGTNCRLYLNGDYKSLIAASGNGSTGFYADKTSLFCSAGYSADVFTSAKIDDVAIFNTALSADQIKELYEGRLVGEGYPHGTPAPRTRELNTTIINNNTNLKAYYRFESGAETTDSSGNANTLSAIGVPTYSAGKFGQGVDLVTDKAFSITDGATVKPTGNWTIGAWIKTSASGSDFTIFQSQSRNTNRAGIWFNMQTSGVIYIESGKNTGTVNTVDFQTAATTATVNNGVWHFVTAVWDGSYLRLYIDGVHSASTAWANAAAYAATNYVRVGCYNLSGANGGFFNGALDDVFLLNGTALTSSEIQELYWQDGGPVALYHLSDTTDFSGNNYHLTNTGTTTFVAGKFVNAGSFNGSSKTLSIADASCPNLELSGSRTISAWINPGSVSITQAIVGKRGTDYASNLGYLFYIDTSSKLHLTIDGLTTNTDVASLKSIVISTWQHVVGVYDGSNLKVYINGNLDNSAVASGTGASANSWPFAIGSDNQGAANAAGLFFNGLIDEVAVFNVAKDARWVRQQYALGMGRLI